MLIAFYAERSDVHVCLYIVRIDSHLGPVFVMFLFSFLSLADATRHASERTTFPSKYIRSTINPTEFFQGSQPGNQSNPTSFEREHFSLSNCVQIFLRWRTFRVCFELKNEKSIVGSPRFFESLVDFREIFVGPRATIGRFDREKFALSAHVRFGETCRGKSTTRTKKRSTITHTCVLGKTFRGEFASFRSEFLGEFDINR